MTRTIHKRINGKVTQIPEWVEFTEEAVDAWPYWKLTLSVVNPPEEAIGEHYFEIVDRLVNYPQGEGNTVVYKIEVTDIDLSLHTPPYFKNKESDWGPHYLKPGEEIQIDFEFWDDENEDERTNVFLEAHKVYYGKLAGE